MYDQMQTCYRHPDQPAGVICQRCDRPICPRCMNQASVGFHCPECAKVGAQKVYRGTAALQTRPLLTQVLIAANVAVFVLAAVIDGGGALQGSIGSVHIDFGLIARAFYRGELIGVAEGEWYRMVTSGFLHFGVIHLLFNMYALWILGGAVEHLAGRARLAAGYGVSVLAGSLGALILSPDSLTAGASGGVFGLMGFILVAQRLQGLPFRDSPLIGVLVLNLFITFGISNISVGGHVGGLLGGAAAGFALSAPALRRQSPALGFALCIGLAIGCLVGGIGVASAA
ncbi:MAG: rhomboid family intramembrane serine protease [Acidimicrobiales bacterium]|nr:rhomboid family intramembrane serine protease [Acidimicrobiales bacterium]